MVTLCRKGTHCEGRPVTCPERGQNTQQWNRLFSFLFRFLLFDQNQHGCRGAGRAFPPPTWKQGWGELCSTILRCTHDGQHAGTQLRRERCSGHRPYMAEMIQGAPGTCCGGFTGVVSPPFVLFPPLKIFPADIKLREAGQWLCRSLFFDSFALQFRIIPNATLRAVQTSTAEFVCFG